MFGLVVPHRTIYSEFLDEGSGRWSAELPNPNSITEICVFLQQPLLLQNVAVGIYFAFPPYQSHEFLGVISNSAPSEIFSTGWSLVPDIANYSTVKIGFSVEPLTELMKKLEIKPALDFKKEFGRKVAENLFNYIESYDAPGLGFLANHPGKVLESWLLRFEEKYKIDPNFVMRSG